MLNTLKSYYNKEDVFSLPNTLTINNLEKSFDIEIHEKKDKDLMLKEFKEDIVRLCVNKQVTYITKQ